MAQETDAQLQARRAIIENETATGANTTTRVGDMFENIIDSKVNVSELSREFNRTFVEALVFDKNEIFHQQFILTDDLNLTIGEGGLIDQPSAMRFRFTTDGTHAINFGSGFDFLYGISNGQILSSGTYEVYLLYTNGSVSVNIPGTTSEQSGLEILPAPSNFEAVPGAGDPETEVDLTWDDNDDESSYQIQYSETGGSGPWIALTAPAQDVVSYTHTGLTPGATYHYRIRAIGDGVVFGDSAYSIDATTTESSGDVTAPTFTFLPANGNADWTVNEPITITANEAIRNTDGSEITNANVATRITLKETNSGGADIAFTATIDASKTVITITPTTHYGENQLVYVAVNNVEDVNGNEVTVAISSTFTTTEYTLFNGTSNRLLLGDVLDSLFSANDTNFWLELTVNDLLLSGSRIFMGKHSPPDNQRAFYWYHVGSDVLFGWFKLGNGTDGLRFIRWTGALSAGEHDLVLKYDGSIDTNDGLDRLTLLVDGVTAGSKTLELTSANPISGIAINNSSAQFVVGTLTNSAGTPLAGIGYLSGKAKDFIIRSTGGSVVEVNIPNIKTGVDTSGNSIDGTWV